MLKVERAFIRECLRDYHLALGIRSKGEAIAAIRTVDPNLDYDSVRSFVYEQQFKGDKDGIAGATLRLFAEKRDQAIHYLRRHSSASAAIYLDSIIKSYSQQVQSGPRGPIVDIVMDNWRDSFVSGNASVLSGVYQIFRRFKPRIAQMREDRRTRNPDPEDIIITELMYLDSEAMECVLATSEGNVYWGTLHLNHTHTLYGILQRPEDGAHKATHSVHQRLYAIHTKLPGAKRRAPIYSGLYIKTGDFTERPLCGESLFNRIPQRTHKALYEAMITLLKTEFSNISVSENSEIVQYLSGFDRSGRENYTTLADIPLIRDITRPKGDRVILFRGPSRAVDAEVLEELALEVPLEVFCRKPSEDRS